MYVYNKIKNILKVYLLNGIVIVQIISVVTLKGACLSKILVILRGRSDSMMKELFYFLRGSKV